MPRFFFDYTDAAGTSRDELGLELPGLSEAIEQARLALAEAMSDATITADAIDPVAVTIDVRIESGELIYTAVGVSGGSGPENPLASRLPARRMLGD